MVTAEYHVQHAERLRTDANTAQVVAEQETGEVGVVTGINGDSPIAGLAFTPLSDDLILIL